MPEAIMPQLFTAQFFDKACRQMLHEVLESAYIEFYNAFKLYHLGGHNFKELNQEKTETIHPSEHKS